MKRFKTGKVVTVAVAVFALLGLLSSLVFAEDLFFVHSSDISNSLGSIPEVVGPSSQIPTNSEAEFSVNDLFHSDNIDRELYIDGALIFKFEEVKYAVKMGYRKGRYSEYEKNYKAKQVFIVSEISNYLNGDDKQVFPTTLDIIDGENNIGEYPIAHPDSTLVFEHISNELRVYHLVNPKTGFKKLIKTFLLKDIRQAWTENAERYTIQQNERKIYLIPQGVDKRIDWKMEIVMGFVLSEGAPYYHTTGLPLDFVELLRYDDSIEGFSYKPVAYSLPMNFAFEKKQAGNWNVRDIVSSELDDVLNDEAQDISGK